MAELAIASGIAGLCNLVIESVKVTCAFGADIASAERTVLDFLAALRSLEAVLIELESTAQASHFKELLGTRPDVLSNSAIQDCKKHVTQVNLKLSRRLADDGHIKLRSALCWPLKKKETLESVRLLHQYRDTFHAALSSEMMKVAIATYEEVHSSNELSHREKVLAWLSPLNIQSRLQMLSSSRFPGTCSWALDPDLFQSWTEGSIKKLWCYGPPGSGKSVLSSAVAEKLGAKATCLLHFCDHQAQESQHPDSILRSLIKQISAIKDAFPRKLMTLYEEQQNASRTTEPTPGQLLHILDELRGQVGDVYVVFDGLDECENRRQIIQLLSSICKAGVSVMIMSRKLPDIEDGLRDWSRFEYLARENDLKDFVDDRISELELDLGDSLSTDLREVITSKILVRTDGIFLLCRLIMDDLQSSVNIAQVRISADRLPTNLQEMYQKTTDRLLVQAEKGVPKATLAVKVLSLIAFTARPLHIGELRHAIATEVGDTDLNRERLTAARILLSSCLGLIQTDETGFCHYVHLTAYDFFRSHFIQDQVNLSIAKTCVAYLSFKVFSRSACQDQESLLQRVEDYPLSLYAAQYLGHHVRRCECEIVDQLLCLLHERTSITSLSQFWYFRHRKDADLKARAFETMPIGRSALQFACGAGMISTARRLIEAGADVAEADAQGWSALHSAASYCQSDAINLLVEENAPIELRDHEGWTPLFWSCFKGHQDATVALLKHKASPQAVDRSGWTPLHWAAWKGDEAMVRILDPKLDLRERTFHGDQRWNKQVESRFEPFFLAADRGNNEAFEAMVDTSASRRSRDATAYDDDVQTDADTESYNARLRILRCALGKSFFGHMRCRCPTSESMALPDSFLLQLLDAAIRFSHLDVVRLLLERDLNLAPKAYGELTGRSVLHTAAFCNEGRIISLLVQHNADPMQKDNHGYYPLELAVRNGSESVVRAFMSEPKANEIIKKSKTVMHLIWSNTKLMQQLSARTDSGAAEEADELYASTLFNRQLVLATEFAALGADMTTRGDNGRTALHSALDSGPEAIDFLVSRGLDINAQDSYDRTPLHFACNPAYTSKNELLVRHLLSLGANLNIRDRHGDTALLTAIEQGDVGVIKMLINQGADTTTRDHGGMNCLHRAAVRRYRVFSERGIPLAKDHVVSFVQYLARTCDPRASIDQCRDSPDAHLFPFELGGQRWREQDSTVSRTLFELAIEADRRSIEAHLADESLWPRGSDWSISRRSERNQKIYLSWLEEIDRGDFDPAKDPSRNAQGGTSQGDTDSDTQMVV